MPREPSSAVLPREMASARPKPNSYRLWAEQQEFNCFAATDAKLVSALTAKFSRDAKRHRLQRFVMSLSVT